MGKTVQKRKPTVKQQLMIQKALENGGNISKAMRDAGYSPATAKNPQKMMTSPAVKTLKAKLMKKYGLDMKLVTSIYSDAAKANKVATDKETGDLIVTNVPDINTRLKAADRIKNLLDEDLDQKGGSVLAVDNPQLVRAMKDGDTLELQRIVFNKKADGEDASA